MGKYDIDEGVTTLVRKLYEKAKSKVLVGDGCGKWFRTSVGVRQGCLLSPTLFNWYLKRIMTHALDEFEEGIRCAGKRIPESRFDDDIDPRDEN